MEILMKIFLIVASIVGIIISLEILYACTIGLFLEKRKKKRLKKPNSLVFLILSVFYLAVVGCLVVCLACFVPIQTLNIKIIIPITAIVFHLKPSYIVLIIIDKIGVIKLR